MIIIDGLEPDDRPAWQALFAGYHEFYRRPTWPQENYDRAGGSSRKRTGCTRLARALIAAVREWAGEQGCDRVYWHTQATNHTARRLYDQVAENRGFIQYVIPLQAPA